MTLAQYACMSLGRILIPPKKLSGLSNPYLFDDSILNRWVLGNILFNYKQKKTANNAACLYL